MTTTTDTGYAGLAGLMTRMTGDEKHEPAATSTLDVLWVLYDRVLCVDPAWPADPGRDRFLLSKGHGPMALYAVLAAKGFLDPAALDGFARYDSRLGHHPDRTLVPGVEISSGSLGHGLGLAVGTALGETHFGSRDVALLDTLDGWTVHVPGHADEAEAVLRAALSGDDRVYVRLTGASNAVPHGAGPDMTVLRRGSRGTVVTVGPMADRTLTAVEDLDVTVLYAPTVRPFDGWTLRATLSEPDVVLVEPYLADTSTPQVAAALSGVRHRVLGLGVGRAELRRYGTAAEHDAAHGLDVAGIRRSVREFLS